MGKKCLVWTCDSAWGTKDVTFHSLGKTRYKSWLEAVGRSSKENISINSVICSKHFEKSDFVVTKKRINLKKDAIPKLFLPPNIKLPRRLGPRSSSDISLRMTSAASNGAGPSLTCAISSDSDRSPKSLASSSSDSAGLKGTPKKCRKLIHTFHSYATTPEAIKTKLIVEKKKIGQLKKKTQLICAKNKRLRVKVTHLKQIVNCLQKKQLLSTSASDILEKSFSGIPLAIMKRMLRNFRHSKTIRRKYDKVIRSFAMTLNFYSTKAYEYVRKTFNLALPSLRTIRGWYSNISCEPGFSQAAFDSLKLKVQENNCKGQSTIYSLMFDEMSLKKHIEIYNSRAWGYINIGSNVEMDDMSEYATEALVLMVVALNATWKLPIAYFFINGLNGVERANIIKEALYKLKETDVIISSLSFDGLKGNFAMRKELGAEVSNIESLKTYFFHPEDNSKIFFILDACHMVKLIRNNWAILGKFIDPEGEIVDFGYIKMLHNIQEQEGLRLGTKLKSAHIDWTKQKMKVSLAVQTLSDSVAAAIEFLMIDMKDARFRQAAPTIKFIRLIDQLFDLFNSRNPLSVKMKMPLSVENYYLWEPKMNEGIEYLKHCTTVEGVKLINSNKRTGFIGFIINCLSAKGLYEQFVKPGKPLKYILTYKLSTDHLELFFCSIRSRNGWNNNPSCVQFFQSYRRLLLHHDIKNMTGNCVPKDVTNILFVTKNPTTETPIGTTDVLIMKKYDILDNYYDDKILHDHDYHIPINISLSDISENIVTYIAGYAVNMAIRLIRCRICTEALYDFNLKENSLKLLLRKEWGSLTIPSKNCILVCLETEKLLRKVFLITNNKVPSESNFIQSVVSSLHLKLITNRNIFIDLKMHNLQCLTLEENHVSRLIKTLIVCYLKIRLFNAAKCQSYNIKGAPLRKKLSKLILFSHQ